MTSSLVSVSRAISREASGVDKREIDDVLAGNLSLSQYPLSRTIRVFVSSEWSDAAIETEFISKHVFPKLHEYCCSKGLQFHAVDFYNCVPKHLGPHSGDRDEREGLLLFSLERQGALKLALEEIKLCQQVSAGPNFVTLLAQRYGHKPLHTVILEEDFTQLVSVIEDPTAKELVTKWYKLDSNALPPEYVLQLCDYSKLDSVESWPSIHDSLSKTIRKAAKIALGKNVSKAQYYIMSAVEQEVSCGIFNLKQNPNFTCFWFKRIFTDILEQNPLTDSALSVYSDVTNGRRGLEFDSEAMKALNHLKEARLPAKYIGLDAANIHDFPLQWQKNKGLDPFLNPTHSDYLLHLVDTIVSTLSTSINDIAELFEFQEENLTYHEVQCHGTYAREKAQNCWNRPKVISTIDQYITSSSSSHPLVVYGPTGSGKTCIMACAAYRLREKFPLKNMTTIVRFLATTPHSSSIRNTLRSICEQLSTVYHEDPTNIPGDYKSISGHFVSLLSKATANKPIVIFLDGVDQLSSADGASGMSWLPLTLPPHVKIVLSTSSEVHFRCYPVLQSLLYGHQDCFVEVPMLTLSECKEFLRHSLSVKKRQLTKRQEETATKAFHQCPLPLYFQFLMDEISSWCSYTTEIYSDGSFPPSTLQGVTESLFKKLETKCGQTFVSHALGYITASMYGLTEMEVLDILACDEEVMMEVNRGWRRRNVAAGGGTTLSQLSLIPPLLWSQFYHSLFPFLELQMGPGGYLVFCWSHRHFKDAASEQYLMPEAIANQRYSKIAEYFSGASVTPQHRQGTGNSSPKVTEFEDSASQLCSPTASDKQPLFLNKEQHLYNVRKLVELPNSLAKCGRLEELLTLLTDYSWLKACIHTMSCADLVECFSTILPVVPLGRSSTMDKSLHDVQLLRDALSLSVDALNSDLGHLQMQLLGRLMPYTNEERSMLKKLVIEALEDSSSSISPLQPHFNLPGGPLLVSMEGHRDVVSGIASALVRNKETGDLKLVIVSSSWDKSLKSWDLKSAGVLKTFDGHTNKVLCIALTMDGQYAVSGSSDKTVKYWFVPTGEALYTMCGHTAAVNAVAITSNGCKTISGSSDTTIKFWNTDITSSSCGQLIFTVKDIKSPVFALALSHDLNLAVGCKNGSVSIVNTVSASISEVSSDAGEGAITALAFVDVESCLYLVTGSEGGVLKVWEFDQSRCLHILDKPEEHNLQCSPLKSLAAGLNGKIIASFTNDLLSVYDLKSGQHLFKLSGHTGVVYSTNVTDGGNLALSGAADNSINIWDLQSSPVLQATQQHSGNVNTVAISSCETYGVSTGEDTTVKIYEPETMKVLREIPTGHSGAINDIILMRDSQHLLTASSDGTIQVWNGQTKELEKTFKDHESGVNCIALTADSELLMSGGDDNQVIFWSMKTGKKLKTLSNHSSAIVAVNFAQNPNAYYMLSASRDGLVCIRDFYSAKVLLSKQTHTDDLLCLAVSPNACFLATGSKDKSCHVLSIPDGKLVARLVGHKRSVRCVSILHDNEACLTASEDCTLRIWSISDSECLAVFRNDLPILSCDIGCHSNIILYGTTKGCVATALYQPPESLSENRHPLLKRFQGIKSCSASTFTEGDTLSCRSIASTTHSTIAPSESLHDANGAYDNQDTASGVLADEEEIQQVLVDGSSSSHVIDVEVKIIEGTQQDLSSSSIDNDTQSPTDHHTNSNSKAAPDTNRDLSDDGDGVGGMKENTDGGADHHPKSVKRDSSSSGEDNIAPETVPKSSTCSIV